MKNDNSNNTGEVFNAEQSGSGNTQYTAHEINFYSNEPKHPNIYLDEVKVSYKNEIIVEAIKSIVGAICSSLFVLYENEILQFTSVYYFAAFICFIAVSFIISISATFNIITLFLNRRYERAFRKADLFAVIFKTHSRTERKYYRYKSGELYRIRGCACPFCEVDPKGFMRINFNSQTGKEEWVCSNNSDHIIPFDPQKKYEGH